MTPFLWLAVTGFTTFMVVLAVVSTWTNLAPKAERQPKP